MSEPQTPPVPKRPSPSRTLRWLPASHREVWAAAAVIWLLLAVLTAAVGWSVIRTLAPAALLAVVGAVESHRLRRRAQAAPAQD
jgi:predicted membrane-bound mannosyltransferase